MLLAALVGGKSSPNLFRISISSPAQTSLPFISPMPLLQPRVPFRKWLRTSGQVSRLALLQNATQRQAFHASPSFSALQSPAARIARQKGNRPAALSDGKLITHHFPLSDIRIVNATMTLEDTLAKFNKTGASYWASACKEGILHHHHVSLISFMEVGRALLTIAWDNNASAMAIRRISTGEFLRSTRSRHHTLDRTH